MYITSIRPLTEALGHLGFCAQAWIILNSTFAVGWDEDCYHKIDNYKYCIAVAYIYLNNKSLAY